MSHLTERVVQLTKDLIKASTPNGDDAGGQALIAKRLGELGFATEEINLPNCPNLLAMRGEGQELFAFSGHTDVVPPGSGWSVDPFAGSVVDGQLIGRGVADMKGAVAAWCIALEEFLECNPNSKLPLAVAIAGDEETSSKGTPALIERIESLGKRVRLCLVGEPSSTDSLGDCVRIGRRGSLNAKVIVKGEQGHTAYAHLAKNPIPIAAKIIARLSELDLDASLPTLAPSKGDQGWPKTSLAFSSLEAGLLTTTNVIPAEARFNFDIRYRVPLTRERLIEIITPILNDYSTGVSVTWSAGSFPYDSAPGALREAVFNALEMFNASPIANRDGGTSDGRFFARHGAEVVEMGPSNATIHKVNEKLPVSELGKLAEAYLNVIERVAIAWR